MEQNQDRLKDIISHAKEYGFVFPSSEIYDGLAATYDYGQLGAELKNNIKTYWWKAMVQLNENIVGIDAAIFMHPTTWKASGHVDAFNDPLIDNKDSKKRYRADVLLEEHIEKIRQKINKEVEKARGRFGAEFNESQFISTNPNPLDLLVSLSKTTLAEITSPYCANAAANVSFLVPQDKPPTNSFIDYYSFLRNKYIQLN